jgi:hypothetical protein
MKKGLAIKGGAKIEAYELENAKSMKDKYNFINNQKLDEERRYKEYVDEQDARLREAAELKEQIFSNKGENNQRSEEDKMAEFIRALGETEFKYGWQKGVQQKLIGARGGKAHVQIDEILDPKPIMKPLRKYLIRKTRITEIVKGPKKDPNPKVKITSKPYIKLAAEWSNENADGAPREVFVINKLLTGKIGEYKLPEKLFKVGASVYAENDYTGEAKVFGVFVEYSPREIAENPDLKFCSEKFWRESGLLVN